ncbi:MULTISPECIES: hypothetical protein [Bradyrhizobium]|uniref:Cytochrome c domain-containing protein n=1 Tax=Bradyrhizobium elkanii TaxID=29448 RepID=A0A4U6RYA0_BRAEL|nr:MULTISPECIES: hypothetical protein [Bradyrhizobium]MTV13404.1 hypothetical protein [Bradyrhizobium sp. BR2003]TKV77286.1 hypothetical protein FDV58_32665 [Bradyrhizobium elkanii]
MLSRALSLATVALLIGCLSAVSAQAQNLEAGKSPSQIFASTCTACHKSPRGLLKSVPAGSLPGFLRQHYTTSGDMAGVLASYLISNGANDPRYQAKDQPKGTKDGAKGRDGRQEANQSPEQPSERPARRRHQDAAPQEGAKPDADGLNPEGRPGRHGKRMVRPSEAPEGAKPDDGQTPQAAGEGKPSRQKHGRRGKPVEEPKSEDGSKSGAATSEPKTEPKAATKREDKGEAEKPAKPAAEPDTAKVDAPKSNGGGEPAAVRPDPVPQVTPAPAAAAPAASEPAAAATPAPAPAAPPVTATAPPPPPPTTPGSGPPEAPTSK